MQSIGVKGRELSDSDRLRELILNQLANGGTVKEACQRFEFETAGAHKANASMMKWYLFLRFSSGRRVDNVVGKNSWLEEGLLRDGGGTQSSIAREPKSGLPGTSLQGAPIAGNSLQGLPVEDTPPHLRMQDDYRDESEENSLMPQDASFITISGIKEDEVAHRLLQAVSGIVDDRRQMKDAIAEFKKQIEMLERQLRDSDDERKMLEFKLEKKSSEVDRQQRLVLDHQYKYEQLQEEFAQMQTNHQAEHNRLQEKVNELTSQYQDLSGEYTRVRRDSAREIERLEMQLRNAELRNTQLTAKYEEIRKDNANLTRRVTDFAHQISTFMDPAAFTQPSLTPVPIRAVVDGNKQDAEDRAKA